MQRHQLSNDGEETGQFAPNVALRGDNEIGVASVSSSLFSNVTRYHAQIGASVPKETLQQLEWNLLAEAKTLFHQRKFEEALNTFTHCLAVTEKTRSATDHAVRGAVIHNIASCLHNLGEMEAAQAYYEQAIDAFKKAKTPLIERAIYGDANKRRIEFVKERLVDISWGRKPDGDKYLDENGVKRPVAPVLGQLPEGAVQRELSRQWLAPPDVDTYMEPGLPSWASAQNGDHSLEMDSHQTAMRRSHNEYVGRRTFQPSPSPQNTMPHGQVDPEARFGALESQGFMPGEQPQGSSEHRLDAPSSMNDNHAQEAARKEWLQYHLQVRQFY